MRRARRHERKKMMRNFHRTYPTAATVTTAVGVHAETNPLVAGAAAGSNTGSADGGATSAPMREGKVWPHAIGPLCVAKSTRHPMWCELELHAAHGAEVGTPAAKSHHMRCGGKKCGSSHAGRWAKFAFVPFGGGEYTNMLPARAIPHLYRMSRKNAGEGAIVGQPPLACLLSEQRTTACPMAGQDTTHPPPPPPRPLGLVVRQSEPKCRAAEQTSVACPVLC